MIDISLCIYVQRLRAGAAKRNAIENKIFILVPIAPDRTGDILAIRVSWFAADAVKKDIEAEIAALGGTTTPAEASWRWTRNLVPCAS